MKKTALALCFLLLFCACASELDVIRHDEASGDPEQAETQEAQGLSERALYRLIDDAIFIYGRERYLLLVGSWENYGEDTIACRLIAMNGSVDETIDIPYTDGLFFRSFVGDGADQPECLFSPYERTVTLRVQHHIYHLDFEAGTWDYEAQYREQDFQQLIVQSPDGNLSVYLTYFSPLGGESSIGNYVVLDETTREIWFLASYIDRDDVFFIGNDAVFVNQHIGMGLFDASTGERLPNSPRLDHSDADAWEGSDNYLILGAAYDAQRDLILVAYRDDDLWQEECPVYLAAFDQMGEMVLDLDTGWSIYPSCGSFWNLVELELLGGGTVVLRSYGVKEDALSGSRGPSDFEEVILGAIQY